MRLVYLLLNRWSLKHRSEFTKERKDQAWIRTRTEMRKICVKDFWVQLIKKREELKPKTDSTV